MSSTPAKVEARALLDQLADLKGTLLTQLSEALDRLERDRDALMESYVGMISETLEDLASEERHRIYKLLWLGVRFHPDWSLEITGVFAQEEESEMGSSYSKLSPLSV